METLEALPFQVSTARSLHRRVPGTAWAPARSAAATTRMARRSRPTRTICACAWRRWIRACAGSSARRGPSATSPPCARTGIDALTIGAPTGPLRHHLSQGRIRTTVLRRPGRAGGVPGVPCDQRAHPRRRREASSMRPVQRSEGAMPGLPCRGWHHAVAGQPDGRTAAACASQCSPGATLGAMVGALLDERSFDVATAHPVRFQKFLATDG
mgnify:CR=1 FL=1